MSSCDHRSGGCRRSRFKPLLRLALPFFPKTGRSSEKNYVDLRSMFPPIEQQKDLASCVGHALGAILEYLYFYCTGSTIQFSRLFIYYNARILEDEVSNRDAARYDAGADVQFALVGLMKYGCCEEQLWPFYPEFINSRPSNQAYIGAKKYEVTELRQLSNDLQQLRECLDEGYPFIMAIRVYRSFDKNRGDIIPMPKLRELASKYRHAVVCVGYIHSKRIFIIRNSYGTSWGDNGYGYLPYSFVADKYLCKDMWAIKSVRNINDFASEKNRVAGYTFDRRQFTNDDSTSSDDDENEDDYQNHSFTFEQSHLPIPMTMEMPNINSIHYHPPILPLSTTVDSVSGPYSFYTSMISPSSFLRPF